MSTTMSLLTRVRVLLLALAILAGGFAALAPHTAQDASAASVSMYGGLADYYVTFGSYGKLTVQGTVYDRAADGSCARVEVKPNTGTSSWTWAGRACGNGTGATVYLSDRWYGLSGAWVRLCVGSSCTGSTYWAK